jgi:predicted DNA-binding transcriptional regulator AlpA
MALPLYTSDTQQIPIEAGYRDERFAAVYLGVSVETIRAWRKQKRGPRFRKIGGRSVRYSLRDLISFAEASPSGGGQAA